ncbi:siderophore-interacting protein [Nocardioides immobilis]|uniref:Siderophore-interacting protein n=1 Tax=Nocardioides immobilis TaxID=2049295 RepID=A0A417Y4N0_9ACTN|nr:siderophore-interacting protein [Nocardioides immobilis]RHW27599.1 siderophore-interacting protein [Nocardioides immobilis]
MSKPITPLTVTASEQLSPGMVRLHFRSDDLSAFLGNDFTDRYVKLIFGDPELLAQGERPTMRTYTVIDPDPETGTLAIDFVVHGTEGIAGPWASTALPGDTISVRGPSGAYAPDPTADWHLFAGDEAAIPAIRQSLAALPSDAQGYAVVQVGSAAKELPLPAPAGVGLHWLHRDDPASPGLAAAVRDLPWRDGRVDVFVHGEAQAVMKEIRPHLVAQGVDPRAASISGYWKRGLVDEEFRAWKREQAVAEPG